ncbi:kinase-like domain-containing protein [Xylariaceae sp. AK1471]|nr:kinase-like domain-containing protein [Xylariaceae sp. AK1471]
MVSLGPVRDSVKQINDISWLIGSKHILRHIQGPYAGKYLQKNSDGSCYTLSDAPATLPDAGPIPQTSHVRQVHDAGDASAVFSFGDKLILKVKLISEGGRPQEHETLAFLAKQQLSFKIPTVVFHIAEGDRIYLFEPHMPGRRLNEAWWDMDAKEKEHISTRIAHICSELKAFQSSFMTGVDHKWMNPLREPGQRDYSPEALQKHCEELGMDCSTYVLSHNDLGPTNILIAGDQIAIIDWDLAGYCPAAWVRTKFAVCGALDVERVSGTGTENDSAYRMQVEQKLGHMGFPEVMEAYKRMEKTRMAEWIEQRPWLQ